MKFALLTVSYAGLFYSGKALSVEEQIHKAKALGFDALAIETKRPVASPIDLTKFNRARIRSVAADEGIALCAVECMSNFSSHHSSWCFYCSICYAICLPLGWPPPLLSIY